MRLGIDLDGVVANFTKGWVDFYNRDFGADVRIEDAVEWDGVTSITHFRDMDEFWDWTASLDGRSLFWHLEPFPGAIETLPELADDGHEIVVLTAKPTFAVDDTYEWISLHRLPAAEVHILEDKWRIPCDVYLDDGPHVLPGLVRHRPDRVVCRYVRPWNDPIDGTVDIADFAQFRDLVSGLDKHAPASR